MDRGKFISFEGGEGTGKSTQIKKLAGRLAKRGIPVVETREPGGTEGAEIIRRAVLSGRVASLGPFAEALMMTAARDDHLEEVIRPALAAGTWVLCDRFADSTRAYQGALGGLAPPLISALEHIVVGGDRPDLTLVLDLDPQIGIARARAATASAAGTNASDRFEDEAIDAHRKLREAFLAIARDDPARCIVIDAEQSIAAVAKAVWAAVSDRLGLKDSVRKTA
jgi:dTMP kinase